MRQHIYPTSIDYDPSSGQTSTYYAAEQDTFRYAITGRTLVEIMREAVGTEVSE